MADITAFEIRVADRGWTWADLNDAANVFDTTAAWLRTYDGSATVAKFDELAVGGFQHLGQLCTILTDYLGVPPENRPGRNRPKPIHAIIVVARWDAGVYGPGRAHIVQLTGAAENCRRIASSMLAEIEARAMRALATE